MPMLTYGGELQKISSTHKVGHIMTEDSAFSIYYLIVRSEPTRSESWAELERWIDRRTGTDMLRLASLSFLGDLYGEALRERVWRTAARRVDPFVAEFVSQAILRRLGVGVAPAEICASDKIPSGSGYVVKAVGPTGDLKFAPTRRGSEFVLVSRTVPNAASLDYIRRKYFSSLRSRYSWRGLGEIEIGEIDDRLSRETLTALWKSCPSADELFREFRPADLYRIKRSIDGEPYLRILAARVFLGTSAGHFANILSTDDGYFISVDHARMQRENGDDLRMLFRFVRRGSPVFDLLGEVAALTEDDVRSAVAEIPQHAACGSTGRLCDYFCERLELWKTLYTGKPVPERAAASAAV